MMNIQTIKSTQTISDLLNYTSELPSFESLNRTLAQEYQENLSKIEKFQWTPNNLNKAEKVYQSIITALYRFLFMAINNNDIESTRALIKGNFIDINFHHNSATPLMFAISLDRPDIVLVLLSRKDINVHFRNEAGYTAIMLAARVGSLACLKHLIDHGAELNNESELAEKGRKTPLYLAAKYNRYAIVKYLLSLPAVDTTVFYKGRDLLSVAKKLEHYETVAVLEKHQISLILLESNFNNARDDLSEIEKVQWKRLELLMRRNSFAIQLSQCFEEEAGLKNRLMAYENLLTQMNAYVVDLKDDASMLEEYKAKAKEKEAEIENTSADEKMLIPKLKKLLKLNRMHIDVKNEDILYTLNRLEELKNEIRSFSNSKDFSKIQTEQLESVADKILSLENEIRSYSEDFAKIRDEKLKDVADEILSLSGIISSFDSAIEKCDEQINLFKASQGSGNDMVIMSEKGQNTLGKRDLRDKKMELDKKIKLS